MSPTPIFRLSAKIGAVVLGPPIWLFSSFLPRPPSRLNDAAFAPPAAFTRRRGAGLMSYVGSFFARSDAISSRLTEVGLILMRAFHLPLSRARDS